MPAGADGPSTPGRVKVSRRPRQAGSGPSPAVTPLDDADGKPELSASPTSSEESKQGRSRRSTPPPAPQGSSWEWVEGRQRTPNGVEKTFERRLIGNPGLIEATAPEPAGEH